MNEHEQLLTEVLKCRRIDLFVDPKILSSDQEDTLSAMKTRRSQGEPLQYIIGHCDFMGARIHVDQRVLIPRPETEILVNFAIEKILPRGKSRQLRILDLGTGSGNIPIALAKNIENCSIVSVDVSQDALDLAAYNAKINFVNDKIQFICMDMEKFLREARDKNTFDLIISNPPYIRTSELRLLPEDVQREPSVALDGGDDGLDFYRIISENVFSRLNHGGLLMCEMGDHQREQIKRLFQRFTYYNNFESVKDYIGTERHFIVKKK